MIHTEAEYLRSKRIVEESEKGYAIDMKRFEAEGLSKDEVKRLLDPTKAFLTGIKDDVAEYERTYKGHSI